MKKKDIYIIVIALILLVVSLFYNYSLTSWVLINISLALIWVLLYLALIREANIRNSRKFIHIIIFTICTAPFVVTLFFITIWKRHGFGH